ncbi:MAG: hypothetical protein QOF60_2405 [Actinomycetota bacterium]|nr:hypothetical protein [Actinomycetota bacterium]
MDREGVGCGSSGVEELVGSEQGSAIDRGEPHPPLGEPHAIVILEGEGWVVGGDAGPVAVGAGQGVWWSADEVWDIGCSDGRMAYIEVEGIALLPADLE